ncbi:YheC/YheD family protein [Peribacillus asahii]|uniref:YheC/YheD family endospore coat-associated protein n=1 Tax=Peribacillus asahii TaxID=228899 RepID=UPI003829F259
MNGQSSKLLISTIQEKKALMYIDETTFTKWQLQYGETLSLKAGQRSIEIAVESFSSPSRECKLSSSASQYLTLPPFTHPISVTFLPSTKTVIIGPFLALLTNQSLLTDGTFGEMDVFFQEMHTYSTTLGIPFYLTTLQSLESEVITGYWFHENGWEPCVLPFPSALYNRIHSRRLERTDRFEQFTAHLQAKKIPLFNSCFLSKWEVHEMLVQDESLQPHLPDTILLGAQEAFYSFLQHHAVIYVKPIFGSQGKHIGKATKLEKGWLFEHSGNTQDTHFVQSEAELFFYLKKFCKQRSFIIQKGIPLLEWEQKKVDFRILLHQTKEDVWKVTSVVARIGDTGHIVSNIARGAEMKNGSQFLKERFNRQQAIHLYHTLTHLAKKMAHSLDKQHEGLLGELGIDLALDEQFHPWIIEVNSKPSKRFDGTRDKLRPSVKALIDYMSTLHHTLKNEG